MPELGRFQVAMLRKHIGSQETPNRAIQPTCRQVHVGRWWLASGAPRRFRCAPGGLDDRAWVEPVAPLPVSNSKRPGRPSRKRLRKALALRTSGRSSARRACDEPPRGTPRLTPPPHAGLPRARPPAEALGVEGAPQADGDRALREAPRGPPRAPLAGRGRRPGGFVHGELLQEPAVAEVPDLDAVAAAGHEGVPAGGDGGVMDPTSEQHLGRPVDPRGERADTVGRERPEASNNTLSRELDLRLPPDTGSTIGGAPLLNLAVKSMAEACCLGEWVADAVHNWNVDRGRCLGLRASSKARPISLSPLSARGGVLLQPGFRLIGHPPAQLSASNMVRIRDLTVLNWHLAFHEVWSPSACVGE